MVPEIIGNHIYFFAKAIDSAEKDTTDIYLHRVDLSEIEDDSDKFASIVAKKEKK